MKRISKWLLPVAIISLLLATLIGGSCAPQSLGEALDPSGNPFAHRFSDVTDIRTATFVVAASDSEHKFEADYMCDGTDDHVQIQTALDALPATGGSVALLDGSYSVEVSLVLVSYQTLRGQGRNTILTTTTANLDIITATGAGGSEKVGILIADLCVDGDLGGANANHAIIFSYVDRSHITRCWVRDITNEGMQLSLCDSLIIGENTVVNCAWAGIYFEDCLYCTCENNLVEASGWGIEFLMATLSPQWCVVRGNICYDGEYGIYMGTVLNMIVSDNVCYNNSDHGIRVSGDHCTISANECYQNTKAGILIGLGVDECRSSVVGNICADNGDQGIYANGASYSVFADNVCYLNGEEGIYINGSDDTVIANNVCEANSQAASNTDDDIYVYNSARISVQGNVCRAGAEANVPRYGINLSGGCSRNLVIGNDLYNDGFGTAPFNDAEACAIVTDDNRGIEITQIKHLIYVQNTSGGNLLTGNVVKYNAAASSMGFTTPAAVGDDGVWGMLVENINNNAWGYIQVLGGTTLLDATNAVGNIAIGDFLTAEIGVRAQKAAPGNMVFAIALEVCNAGDCVIDALIIVPRKI